jgi:hypothetical protein
LSKTTLACAGYHRGRSSDSITWLTLRDVPELLTEIEHADRSALYESLGLRATYRRTHSAEQFKLTSTIDNVDLFRVGGLRRTI